jgi:hypothetical protein
LYKAGLDIGEWALFETSVNPRHGFCTHKKLAWIIAPYLQQQFFFRVTSRGEQDSAEIRICIFQRGGMDFYKATARYGCGANIGW